MQFTPLGPWGVGASAGPATVGIKGDSGRVQNPNPDRLDQGGKGVYPFRTTLNYYTARKHARN